MYCLHKYPPLPGPGVKLSPIQTFLSDLLDLKLLNSGLKCYVICQNKIAGHKNTVMSLAQTPRVGYQNVRNFLNCGKVGSKQKNTLDRTRYVRDELQKSPWNGN